MQAYQRLRADIVACNIAPGERLNINDLCKTYDVSLGAIRESLSRLASEDLVIAEAQRGFTVAPVSQEELLDLVATRVEIETLCLRRSLELGRVDWETGLIAAGHRLSKTPKHLPEREPHISDEWEAAHEAFHLALVSACDSPWLLRIRASLYTQAERYRRLSLRISAAKRNVGTEHAQLMAAAIARDADTLVRLMGEHMNTTARVILESRQLVSGT